MKVFVVGVGRSGTSIITQILHEKLDVDAGNFDPNRNNYEDRDVREANIAFDAGKISLPVFRTAVHTLLNERPEPWVIKDPRMSTHLGLYLTWFPDAILIHAYRDYPEILASHCRIMPHVPRETHAKEIQRRYDALFAMLTHWQAYTINMTNRWKLQDLEDRLVQILALERMEHA